VFSVPHPIWLQPKGTADKEQGNTLSMMINGWEKESKCLVKLAKPFSVTVYQFGDASEFDYVLDIKNSGQRHIFIKAIVEYNFSPDGKWLFFAGRPGHILSLCAC
jgi:hypothetical protein